MLLVRVLWCFLVVNVVNSMDRGLGDFVCFVKGMWFDFICLVMCVCEYNIGKRRGWCNMDVWFFIIVLFNLWVVYFSMYLFILVDL